MTDHDVIVLGDGPGGYVAAEWFGHVGKNVLLVEVLPLGGTCLNVGCILTKILLGTAKTYDHVRHGAQFGVKIDDAHADWPVLQKWKSKVVSTLVGGIAATGKKAGVTVIHGHSTFDGSGRVIVDGTTHTATHVILATGSVLVMSPVPGTRNSPLVIDSTDALPLLEIPERLTVTGDGVIGVEFASLHSILGTQVTAIEMLPGIAPFADDDATVQLRKTLRDITFKLGCRVIPINGGKVNWTITDGAGESVEAGYVLMAVGRRPVVDGWGAENTGLEYPGRGVVVDDRMCTNLPNTWVIRGVTGRSLLARATYCMGEMAAANILDPKTHRRGEVMRRRTAPWAVYTVPGCVGTELAEAAARKADHDIIAASIPGHMSNRPMAENGLQAPELARLILNAKVRQVLGIYMLGNCTAEMIWGVSAVLGTELDLTGPRQLAFPHPTISELIREAAWAAET